MTALRGVGVMGASMLLRPWIGMLILFLVTRHDTTLAISARSCSSWCCSPSTSRTRILTHKNFSASIGGTNS